MTGLLAFLFVLGVVVFVHELGHFLVARWHGVRVITFSLGFGPKILKMRRGDTEYAISAVPLGGYVKMAGEPLEDRGSGAPDEFLSKTRWQRFQIILAGPVMNFVLAIVVLTGVLYQGAAIQLYHERPPEIGEVVPDSPAARAGIAPGDRIVSVAGRAVPTWRDFQIAVFPHADETIPVVVTRGGQEHTLTATPAAAGRLRGGELGVGPVIHPQVAEVVPGSPAEGAGLQPGDVILAANGDRFAYADLIDFIRQHADRPITLTLRRGSEEFPAELTPELKNGVAMIGASLHEMEMRIIEPGLGQAVVLSVQQNVEWTGLIFKTIGGFFTRETSVRELAGPLGIAQLSGTAAEMGLVALFGFLAMISLNLGLINLLPIPVLDGGSILIIALEGLARRDFSVAMKERIMLAGLVVIVLLMVTVFYVDLRRIGWLDRLIPGS